MAEMVWKLREEVIELLQMAQSVADETDGLGLFGLLSVQLGLAQLVLQATNAESLQRLKVLMTDELDSVRERNFDEVWRAFDQVPVEQFGFSG